MVHGLQLKDGASGRWIYNEDHSSQGTELTIFCNEWLEKVTHGKFRAMRHRVSSNKSTQAQKLMF